MEISSEQHVTHDAAPAYYVTAISKNIGQTPEGYLIARDCVIGRTGSMKYGVSQLSRVQLKDLGLDSKYRDSEIVDVYREPSEVFSIESLSSYESKPVTDNHPNGFVTVKNHRTHCRGHVRNVRAGDKALPSGDLPILADVVITDDGLAQEVLSGRRRELSCGYNYHLAYDGTRLSQVGITGNHVAVVQRGRAGAEARINDAAPRKDYVVTKDTLISLGLSAMAKDNADPTALAAAARVAFAAEAVDSKIDQSKAALEAKDAELATLRADLKKATNSLKARDEEDKKKKDDEDKDKAEDADLESRLKALDGDDEEDEEDDEDEKKKKSKSESEDADFIQPLDGPGDLRAELKKLRPLVARSKDAALRARFDKLAAKANDAAKGGTPSGAYGAVRQAASTASQAADTQIASAEARMNARATKNFSEVK